MTELLDLLDARFDEITPTRVRGSIAADERHHQPWGIVHGGLYTTAIETFATLGAVEALRERGEQAVGVSNVTDFVRPHRTAHLDVVASRFTRAAPSSSGRWRSVGPRTTSSSPAAKCGSRTSRRRRERLPPASASRRSRSRSAS